MKAAYLNGLQAQLFNTRSVQLCLFLLSYFFDDTLANREEIENHLKKGSEFLARGQYSDALSHYHAAIEGDPKNYLTYYKRATVHLALGKAKAALEDLNEVIQLKVDFIEARSQRGSLLLKLGHIDEAHIDFEWVLRFDPDRHDVQQQYVLIEHIRSELQDVHLLMSDYSWPEAIELLTKLIHDMPFDASLRDLRATCFEKVGDRQGAIADIRATTRMKLDDTPGLLRLSKLYYDIAEIEDSLQTIRDCLKLDPDHKQCRAHYKKVKQLFAYVKQMNEASTSRQFATCAEKADDAYKLESNVLEIVQQIKAKKCYCLNKRGDKPVDAIQACSEALKIIPKEQSVNILCDRAEAYINNEDYESAKSDYQQALNIDQRSQRAEDGMRQATKLIKQSKTRDYYKILGVKRNAAKPDILRAYRKLAAQWHPDNFGEEEKAKAEKMFVDIAAAKEVLTDPEKRAAFDNGEDPLDPEAQNKSPFRGRAPNGFPFGDMPFEFKFHF